MGETPSKRRRKGREAFQPGIDPLDIQPYKIGSWTCEMYLRDWLDGWKEAEKQYLKKEKNKTWIVENVGDLRRIIASFTEDCPILLNDNLFSIDYEIDDRGNGSLTIKERK